MSHHKLNKSRDRASIPHNRALPNGHSVPRPDGNPSDEAIRRAMRHVAVGAYQKALDSLRSDGQDARLRNLRAVCLLRLGRYDSAIRVLRDLVLKPGCTWMRPDVPMAYKVNFATALLLGGHPGGCAEMLAELRQPTHPSVLRLQAAIDRWVASLSFWQKLNWRIYGDGPANRPVTIDFLPGELDIEVTPTGRPSPTPVVPDRDRAA
jgi:hypothetical protein